METGAFLFVCCGAIYLAMAIVIAARRHRAAPLLLAACCLVTAGWAAAGLWSSAAAGIGGIADLVRAMAWFGFLFFLYHDARMGRPLFELGFAAAAFVAATVAAVAVAGADASTTVLPLVIIARLTLAVAELLLIENLYLNLPQDARWHVALPSVLLGGLACFDILLSADIILFRAPTPSLEAARTLVMTLIAPLLMVAAARGQRWKGGVRLSRQAAFHSATLVLSGGVLLALGLVGEVLQRLGGEWGWLAQVSLAFAAAIGLGLLMTSGSARSRLQRLVVDHFFAERYDYRRQWQACIRTLAGEPESAGQGEVQAGLALRAIRTVVSVVDSPAGVLFLRDGPGSGGQSAGGGFRWAGSWNMPATDAMADDHPAVVAVRNGAWIARLDGPHQAALCAAPLEGLGPLWLAVPLVHRGVLTGLVLSGPPRAPFDLEQEVFDLLRIVAQEVATYIAEQRATQTLLQTRQLHDYSKRFAFVAHDIKNVSSQLALLLSNAESHIANPEFQKDMLDTVRASVGKITALLRRLETPETDSAPGALAPLPRLEALVATYQRVRRSQIVLEHDGSTASVAMGAEAFETAVTHVLNNAVEACAESGAVAPVIVRVRHEARQVVIDIVDQGPGMTAEFVHDRLFKPFSTSKAGGSGIGAFQSRELLRAAGGDLVVVTVPREGAAGAASGGGTTMRLLLPRTDQRAMSGVGPGRAPVRTLSGVEV